VLNAKTASTHHFLDLGDGRSPATDRIMFPTENAAANQDEGRSKND
jgi:hypothetical protein